MVLKKIVLSNYSCSAISGWASGGRPRGGRRRRHHLLLLTMVCNNLLPSSHHTRPPKSYPSVSRAWRLRLSTGTEVSRPCMKMLDCMSLKRCYCWVQIAVCAIGHMKCSGGLAYLCVEKASTDMTMRRATKWQVWSLKNDVKNWQSCLWEQCFSSVHVCLEEYYSTI
jgi:hypothetical protein